MIYSFTKVICKLISVVYTLLVHNEMMGVILLTEELISLGSTASTYPLPGHLTMIMGGAYNTKRQSRGEQQEETCSKASVTLTHTLRLTICWKSENKWDLTMCGRCCICAATFTFEGPSVLGSSCLATGAAVGWTVTKDRTP